jgi:hypothetical protein
MNVDKVRSRLVALQGKIRAIIERYARDFIDPDAIKGIFEAFWSMREEIRRTDSSLLSDVPDWPQPVPTAGYYDGRGGIHPDDLGRLQRDIEHILALLPTTEVVQVPSMTIRREGVFFAGQFFDALQKATEILTSATKKIVIVDSYVDEKVLTLLTGKQAGVTVEILTKEPKPTFITQAQAFNKQYAGLSIRSSTEFHDRFIIIDDTEFYHFGASIKDLGNKGFMFSRIEEPDVIATLRKKLGEAWATATTIVP